MIDAIEFVIRDSNRLAGHYNTAIAKTPVRPEGKLVYRDFNITFLTRTTRSKFQSDYPKAAQELYQFLKSEGVIYIDRIDVIEQPDRNDPLQPNLKYRITAIRDETPNHSPFSSLSGSVPDPENRSASPTSQPGPGINPEPNHVA